MQWPRPHRESLVKHRCEGNENFGSRTWQPVPCPSFTSHHLEARKVKNLIFFRFSDTENPYVMHSSHRESLCNVHPIGNQYFSFCFIRESFCHGLPHIENLYVNASPNQRTFMQKIPPQEINTFPIVFNKDYLCECLPNIENPYVNPSQHKEPSCNGLPTQRITL